MSAMASHIASVTIVYSTVYSGADRRKHQSSASLAFVQGIHRWPANSAHKGPVTRKLLPFDDVIMSKVTLKDVDEIDQYQATTEHNKGKTVAIRLGMMTSSNGNFFRVTGHLCGEFTGHRWIPRTKASDAELWCFLWSTPVWTVV